MAEHECKDSLELIVKSRPARNNEVVNFYICRLCDKVYFADSGQNPSIVTAYEGRLTLDEIRKHIPKMSYYCAKP